jgi:hypothetical protein
VDEIRRLKASDGPELHFWGSSELLQTLIAAQLFDEFRVWIYRWLSARASGFLKRVCRRLVLPWWSRAQHFPPY